METVALSGEGQQAAPKNARVGATRPAGEAKIYE